jgi:predicted nucleic acid-binding protein
MFALDTNVLVHAHRADMPNHVVAAALLREVAGGRHSVRSPGRASTSFGPS